MKGCSNKQDFHCCLSFGFSVHLSYLRTLYSFCKSYQLTNSKQEHKIIFRLRKHQRVQGLIKSTIRILQVLYRIIFTNDDGSTPILLIIGDARRLQNHSHLSTWMLLAPIFPDSSNPLSGFLECKMFPKPRSYLK